VAGFRTRGQPAALAAIERALRADRPSHALLLVGPGQVGKTTLALDLAAGLLCTAAAPADRPCRACAACRKVDHRNHPDLHRLAPEGAGGQVRLGQVQQLQAELALLPMEGRYRVAIIEAAHRLNQDAQNALLKLLEEPPQRVVIVLAAEDESLLLPTVRSRCARLRLQPLGPGALAGLLAERELADAPRSATLGRLSGGRPGLAIALAGDDDAQRAHERLVRTLLDLTRADRRERLAAAAALLADASLLAEAVDRGREGSPSTDAGTLAESASMGSPGSEPAASEPVAAEPARPPGRTPAPAERRRALIRLLEIWREVGRDLAVAARGAPVGVRPLELLEELSRAARGVSSAELLRFLERLDGLAAAVDAYANPELALDVLLLDWVRPATPSSEAA
jgi:DNA polymerase-3 subunit delta'